MNQHVKSLLYRRTAYFPSFIMISATSSEHLSLNIH